MSKIDLKNYFETNLKALEEFKYLKEYYDHNLHLIKKRDGQTLDKLGDKLLQIIIVFEGDFKIEENVLNFLLEIIQAFVDNVKEKIGYIILLNPILEYLINVYKIQNENKGTVEEKKELFIKEKDSLLFKLDSILEKNFMKVKYAPYLIELIELYNEDNPSDQIDKFWIYSFVKGNQDIFDKISKFYNVEKIDLKNLNEQLELIKTNKNKSKSNNDNNNNNNNDNGK